MAFVPALSVKTTKNQGIREVCARRYGFGGNTVSRRANLARRCAPSMILGKSVGETLDIEKVNPTLCKLLNIAGIDLGGMSGTLFAPTESAFARMPAVAKEYLINNPSVLRDVLSRHIAPEVLTTPKLAGVGYLENCWGGPLAYEGLGPVLKVGGQRVLLESSNRECENAVIHAIDGVLIPPNVSLPTPTVRAAVGDSMVSAAYPPVTSGRENARALGACAPSTSGGRRAMGLVKQLPFYMYGPPFNAGKQEDHEPISIAKPDVSFVDYQIFPPGSVVVEPDEVSAAKLIPVSGMSKYIGTVSRIKEGDAQSDYSRLDS